MKEAIKIGLLVVIVFNLSFIAHAVIDIKRSIDDSRGMYLCVEAWKLGVRPSTCDKLTGRRT